MQNQMQLNSRKEILFRMKKFFSAALLVLMTLILPTSLLAADNSILVNQPAYNSMSFYVFKPTNVPADFYVTYDGYLVYRGSNSVWFYGSYENGTIIRTGFIVGSVIPSVVGLRPYSTRMSSTAPILNDPVVRGRPVEPPVVYHAPVVPYVPVPSVPAPVVPPDTPVIIYSPPAPRADLYAPNIIYSPNATNWTLNSNFMAIGRWRSQVDRVGVINRPMIPVAWKGDYPEVIYAWTGLKWKQLSAKGRHVTAASTLRREIYDLTVDINKINLLNWTDNDSIVLSQYAYMWGYHWVGLVILERNY